eukprot:snap_masked-scaffold_8-processed-gene-7.26-mRNA-1 protein AED:1.00 eAED:1.00 QI:0/-1/0/0/-1/1/1/0/356
MECRSKEGLYGPKLQQACSNCRKKKKKCDSLKPFCTRCFSLGQSCFYEPARKRGRKAVLHKKVVSNKFTKTEKDMIKNLFPSFSSHEPVLSSLNLQIFRKEHLAWKMLEFFSQQVSKNFEALSFVPCYDFTPVFCAGMLYQLGNHLDYRVKHDGTFTHAVDKFTEIVTGKGLTYSGVLETLQRQFYLDNRLEDTKKINSNLSNRGNTPFLLDAADYYPSFRQICKGNDTANKWFHERKYEVNNRFESTFGYSSENLNIFFEQSVNGILPVGSNIISLLSSEEGLLKYIGVFALKAQQYFEDKQGLTMPIEVDLCNNVVLELQTRNGWRKFQVFSLVAETGSFSGYSSEHTVHFVPF